MPSGKVGLRDAELGPASSASFIMASSSHADMLYVLDKERWCCSKAWQAYIVQYLEAGASLIHATSLSACLTSLFASARLDSSAEDVPAITLLSSHVAWHAELLKPDRLSDVLLLSCTS